MSKPSSDARQYLVIAGNESHDPVDVMNAFFRIDENCDNNRVSSEYWQCKIAILCDRICRAEKHLGAVRTELAYRHMAESQVNEARDIGLKLLDIASGPAACNPENQDDINAIVKAARLLALFRDAFLTTATKCETCDEHHWEADIENEEAVCKVCGERDSLDVL